MKLFRYFAAGDSFVLTGPIRRLGFGRVTGRTSTPREMVPRRLLQPIEEAVPVGPRVYEGAGRTSAR